MTHGEDIRYGDYLVEWFKGKRYDAGSQTMKVVESYMRNHIIPLLGDLTLSQLTPIVLQRFVNELQDKGLSMATARRIFMVVQSSLDAAERMQMIEKNPASPVNKPRKGRRELQVWDVDEIQRFLRYALQKPYTYVAFHLALLTGMRQGEILGLRWIDIDVRQEVLFVRQTLSHDGKEFLTGAKTASGIRSIALDPDTVQILTQHRDRYDQNKVRYGDKFLDSGLVVSTQFGGRITPRTLMRIWYQSLRDSELRQITFHDLRHTHASLLLKNNVHPKIVSERLGHSSIQLTLDTYSHLLPNMQRDAADKLGETILGRGKPDE